MAMTKFFCLFYYCLVNNLSFPLPIPVLEFKSRTLHLLGKNVTTELYRQSSFTRLDNTFLIQEGLKENYFSHR